MSLFLTTSPNFQPWMKRFAAHHSDSRASSRMQGAFWSKNKTCTKGFCRHAHYYSDADTAVRYDAVILDLARRERLPLATLDDRPRNAAAGEGVALLRLPFI